MAVLSPMEPDTTLFVKNSQHCCTLHVAYVSTTGLWHVVACCCAKFKTIQTFSNVQTDATTPNNTQKHATGCGKGRNM